MMNSAVCMLDEIVKKYGSDIAVEDETGAITYNDYRYLARCIGTGLLNNQAARRPIIVYLPKSIRALTCFMGAMYCGCPYAPVDSHIPITRLEKIIQSLRPGIIITDQTMSDKLKDCDLQDTIVCLYDDLAAVTADDARIDAALSQVVDTDPIYIMYTSGSTGTPKGVTIPHRGILDYAAWVVETFCFDSTTVMANQAPFYFDNSTFDIYGCIKCGGSLVLIPDNLMMFPLTLPEFLAEKEITSIFWVPTVMIHVANSGALEKVPLPKLRNIAFCGEVMPNTQLNIWRRALPGRTFANLYGPTEITDVCCYYIVDREFSDLDPLPIGKACENMRFIILNEENQPAKTGEQGELCIIGSGVALGYWNAPEITDKVFVRNPLTTAYAERMYRTGDLAYVNDEGLIMFCGRKDSQIKLKGNRIELGEIENAAMCVKGVENVCALFDTEKQEIILFLETKETFTLRKFNLELKKLIPSYMLPARLVTMEKLPHTANDKIDRVALRKTL